MNILTVILLSFILLGFSVLAMAFWAVIYPKTLCQKVTAQEEEWNVCVRPKNHTGNCMSVTGKEFQE